LNTFNFKSVSGRHDARRKSIDEGRSPARNQVTKMNERSSPVDRYLADLEMAYSLFGYMDAVEGISDERLREVAVHAKRAEMKLAAARLAQAEFRLEALLARCDFLEARNVRGIATARDIEELNWAMETLPSDKSTVARLTTLFETLRHELNCLVASCEDSG
jgi:hypothetical protein